MPDLFHFDVPWNPGRIEQRNGRIDRKLQPAARFTATTSSTRSGRKTASSRCSSRRPRRSRRELGSLSKVIDDDVGRKLSTGIRHGEIARLADEMERADIETEPSGSTRTNSRQRASGRRTYVRRSSAPDAAREPHKSGWASRPGHFATPSRARLRSRAPLKPLQATTRAGAPTARFPALDRRAEADPSWADDPGHPPRPAQAGPEDLRSGDRRRRSVPSSSKTPA